MIVNIKYYIPMLNHSTYLNILSSVYYIKQSNYTVYVHVLLATKPHHPIGVNSKHHDWTHDIISWWASAVT